MSRYPWTEYSERFLASMEGVWADSTWKGVQRRLRRMGYEMQQHFLSKKISTTSPRTMTPEDVRFHLVHRRKLDLTQSEYSHELTAMITFFDFCGNTAVRVCLRTTEDFDGRSLDGPYTVLAVFTGYNHGDLPIGHRKNEECWRPDSNRRTPTRKDLESFAFDQAWQLQLKRMM